jgi:hypothetical protein
MLNALIAADSHDAAYQIAEVYAYRGQGDQAFEWLDRAHRQRDAGLACIKFDPLLAGLRKDPRYTNLLKNLRLPNG